MPNGYSKAMTSDRKVSNFSVIFVDESYLQGNTEREYLENIEVIHIKLRFKIHKQKSILKPTKELEFLVSWFCYKF